MARRSRRVYPDELRPTPVGDIPVVSRGAQEQALLEINIVADFNGGILSVLYERKETGIENERVTTGMLLTWQDRTDARLQPEEHLELPGEIPEQDEPEQDDEHEEDDAPAEGAELVGAASEE